MAKLCDNVKAMQSNCYLIDDNKDLTSLRTRTEDVASKLAEIKSATKVCHDSSLINHHLQKRFFDDCLVVDFDLRLFIVRVSGACPAFFACALPGYFYYECLHFYFMKRLAVGRLQI